jgi:hypothetical protein
MPLRGVIYYSKTIERQVGDRDIFGRKLIKIPTPRFAVFYNGTEEQPEQYDMRLSDAFEHPVEKPEIELTCRIYNINRGYNKDLLEKCSVLKEYMIFVDYVRQFRSEDKGAELADTITKAIDRCIEENVLKQFLTEHRSEVTKIMELDYTFDRRLELQREEAREEGLQEGRKEGLQAGRKEGLQAGIIACIEMCQEIEWTKEQAVHQVVKKFSLPIKDAAEYVEQNWK